MDNASSAACNTETKCSKNPNSCGVVVRTVGCFRLSNIAAASVTTANLPIFHYPFKSK